MRFGTTIPRGLLYASVVALLGYLLVVGFYAGMRIFGSAPINSSFDEPADHVALFSLLFAILAIPFLINASKGVFVRDGQLSIRSWGREIAACSISEIQSVSFHRTPPFYRVELRRGDSVGLPSMSYFEAKKLRRFIETKTAEQAGDGDAYPRPC